jgi:FKBP-type peptidyl-prolyl cis-trans isomerase FklB
MIKSIAAVAIALLVACGAAKAADPALSADANAKYLADNAKKKGVVTRPSGLQYRIIQNGSGRHPGMNDNVEVYYTGKLINGVVFDGTEDGFPRAFAAKDLIAGWKEALLIMREGDHWQLVIPPQLAYGLAGSKDGSIPPSQALVFDLQLLRVQEKSQKELEQEAQQKAQEDEDASHAGPGSE